MGSNVKLQGVTLAELLIVVGMLLALLGALVAANMFMQSKKAYDTRKKDHLNVYRRILEDYYADHNRYPTVEQMAYKNQLGQTVYMPDTNLAGKICGNTYTGNDLKPYYNELPCHPRSPKEDYVYFVTPDGQYFAVFTTLSYPEDYGIKASNCEFGCSYFLDYRDPDNTTSQFVFNYKVNSTDYKFDCTPDKLIAYYGRLQGADCNAKCQGCPNHTCRTGWTRLYCNPQWCLDQCNLDAN